jgi:beta-barrel assembly-enhancing protease
MTRACLSRFALGQPCFRLPARWLGLLLILSLLSACASTKLSDAGSNHRAQVKELDEEGLWYEMDKAERTIAQSSERISDPSLQKYLEELNCRLAADICKDIRVYLVRQPYLNAFMAPNGMMVVFTGTLARAQNESQLAAVLGHEIAHYRSRHSLENWRKLKNVSNLMAGVGAVAGGTAAGAVAVIGAYVNLASFSRAQESEADLLGFESLRAAGFDVKAPGQLWAGAYEEERVNPPGFLSGIFASHPATAERRDRLQNLGKAGGGNGGQARYESVIGPYRARWLADELSRRNYAQSEVMLARLAQLSFQQHEVHAAQAELYKRRAKPGDLELAVKHYQMAIRAPSVASTVFRDLGTSYQKLGRNKEAQAAFREYLQREPNATDAAMIRSYFNAN